VKTTSKNRSMVLTPPGAGAIGLVRVAGPKAVSIVARLFRPHQGAELGKSQPGRLRYGLFVDEGEPIDDVVVVIDPGGGEPSVDISCHGGVRVIERVLQALESAGVVLASLREVPGPLWRTSSLIEREAIAELEKAGTARAVRFLAWQRAHLPGALLRAAQKAAARSGLAEVFAQALAGYGPARRLIDGVSIGIVGPPNSGKSTLFNRLVGHQAAVVSARPGTTRDWVSCSIEIAGFPVELLDLAGDRASADPVEMEAIETGRQKVAGAGLQLLVIDGSEPSSRATDAWLETARRDGGRSSLLVVNKIDRPQRLEGGSEATDGLSDPVRISAATGAGEDTLLERIAAYLEEDPGFDRRPCLFTRRQADVVGRWLSDAPPPPQEVEQHIKSELIGAFRDDT
jgi:tRNA modification GTPase